MQTASRRIGLILVGLLFIAASPDAWAADKIGVVLMHGKGATSLPKSPMGRLAATLKKAGFLVATPDMPWSKTRNLAKDYEGSMAEIDSAVESLKKQGATRIVVGGHSMGANAAVGYGARREGLAGIMALAAGHVPDVQGYQATLDNDWRRAKEMVNKGQGDVVATFKDNDQGKKFTFKVKPSVYLSWFDPSGPAAFPQNAAKLKPGTPLLWVIGKNDIMFKRGEAYAYAKAPKNPKSAYVVLNAGHVDLPMKASKLIVDWLKGL
jgi:pimeloyl-ACP methyl ester carboxylesterase